MDSLGGVRVLTFLETALVAPAACFLTLLAVTLAWRTVSARLHSQ